jgi:hypothetical protein
VVGPAIFQLVSLVRLPFTIVEGITQELPLFPEYKMPTAPKPSPACPTRNEKDSICPENSVNGTRGNAGSDNSGKTLPVALQFTVYRSIDQTMNSPDTVPRFIPMALLIYLAILMASNLPWKGVLCPLKAPSRVRAAGAFSFSEDML